MMDVLEAWKIECRNSLQIAKHERFSVEQYSAHPDQIGYQKWLMQQVDSREHKYRPISRLLSEKLVSQDVVKSVFGERILHQAIQLNAV